MRNRVLEKLVVLGVVTLFSVPVTATEAGSTYAGGQFAMLDFDAVGASSVNPSALVGRFGYLMTDHVAIEGRVGFGVGDDSVSIEGFRVDLELENLFGAYVVGYLPLSETVSPYGLVGFTSAKAKATVPAFGFSESDSESGFTWGLGVDVRVTPQVSINGEYVRYLDKSDFDFSALSLGVNFWF